jgi:hypothetical protein
MKKITQLNNEKVSFVQRDTVEEGVICDVYSYDEFDNKDLGIVTVQPGCKTPNQKVVGGGKTLEGWFSGSGTLRIIHVNDRESVHEFNKESDIKEVEVMIGEQMQWQAGENGLKFYEICYPPYKEGRFENLSD